MGKQLVNFITCSCESSAPFFANLQSWARIHAVLVIGLYELFGNLMLKRSKQMAKWLQIAETGVVLTTFISSA
jgi:hypothetical protein